MLHSKQKCNSNQGDVVKIEHFASIIGDATSNLDEEPSVRCRRRPGRRRCSGIVMSYPDAEELNRIYWYYPFVTTRDSLAAGKTHSGTASPRPKKCIESKLTASHCALTYSLTIKLCGATTSLSGPMTSIAARDFTLHILVPQWAHDTSIRRKGLSRAS
jgi:hypothetical protein